MLLSYAREMKEHGGDKSRGSAHERQSAHPTARVPGKGNRASRQYARVPAPSPAAPTWQQRRDANLRALRQDGESTIARYASAALIADLRHSGESFARDADMFGGMLDGAEHAGLAETRDQPRPETTLATAPATKDYFGRASAGAPQPLPYREEMERAFGEELRDVRAFVGRSELDEVGARGAAEGNTVIFKSTSPTRGLVAHEVTHVLQQRRHGISSIAASREHSDLGDASEREADRNAALAAAGLTGVRLTANAVPSARRHLDRGGDEATPPDDLASSMIPSTAVGVARTSKLNITLGGIEFSGAIKGAVQRNAGATKVGFSGPRLPSGPKLAAKSELNKETALDGRTVKDIKSKIASGLGGSIVKGMGQISAGGFYFGFELSYAGPELKASWRKPALSTSLLSLKLKGVGRYQPPGRARRVDFAVELKANVSEKTLAQWIGRAATSRLRRAAAQRAVSNAATRAEAMRIAHEMYELALAGAREKHGRAQRAYMAALKATGMVEGQGRKRAVEQALVAARKNLHESQLWLQRVSKQKTAFKKTVYTQLSKHLNGKAPAKAATLTVRQLIERGIAKVVNHRAAQAIGKLLGRMVPVVNVVLFAVDVYETTKLAKQMIDDGVTLRWGKDKGRGGKGARVDKGAGGDGAAWSKGRGGHDHYRRGNGGGSKHKRKGNLKGGVRGRNIRGIKPVGKKQAGWVNRAIRKVSFPGKRDMWITFEDSKAGKKAWDQYARPGMVVTLRRNGKKVYYGSPAVAGMAVMYRLLPNYAKAKKQRPPSVALPVGVTKIRYLDRGKKVTLRLDQDDDIARDRWSDPAALFTGSWKAQRRVYGDPRYDEATRTVTLVYLPKAVALDGDPGKKRKLASKGKGKAKRRRPAILELDSHEDLERRVDYGTGHFQRRFLGRVYQVRMGGKVLFTGKLHHVFVAADETPSVGAAYTLTLQFDIISSSNKTTYPPGSHRDYGIRLRRMPPMVEVGARTHELILDRHKRDNAGRFKKAATYTLTSRRTGQPAVLARPISYKENEKRNRWEMTLTISKVLDRRKVEGRPAWRIGQVVTLSGELKASGPMFPKLPRKLLENKMTELKGAYYNKQWRASARVRVVLMAKEVSPEDPATMVLTLKVDKTEPAGGTMYVFDRASSTWRWLTAGDRFEATTPTKKDTR